MVYMLLEPKSLTTIPFNMCFLKMEIYSVSGIKKIKFKTQNLAKFEFNYKKVMKIIKRKYASLI